MQDAEVVRGLQPCAQLPRDVERLPPREVADSRQKRPQILSIDVFHREKRVAFGFADVVDTTNVRMRYLPGDPRFVQQLFNPVGTRPHAGRQELQRDRLSQFEIVCPVNLTHATAPEQTYDAVSIRENHAGQESPATVSVRALAIVEGQLQEGVGSRVEHAACRGILRQKTLQIGAKRRFAGARRIEPAGAFVGSHLQRPIEDRLDAPPILGVNGRHETRVLSLVTMERPAPNCSSRSTGCRHVTDPL